MSGNPSKPSNVDVGALQTVLNKLQELQGSIQEGRPGSWDSIGDGNAVANDLKGMQENVAQQMGQYYGDVTYHVNHSWQAIQGGISTLATLLQNTIDAHSNNDNSVAQGAKSVNTTQQPAAPLSEN